MTAVNFYYSFSSDSAYLNMAHNVYLFKMFAGVAEINHIEIANEKYSGSFVTEYIFKQSVDYSTQ